MLSFRRLAVVQTLETIKNFREVLHRLTTTHKGSSEMNLMVTYILYDNDHCWLVKIAKSCRTTARAARKTNVELIGHRHTLRRRSINWPSRIEQADNAQLQQHEYSG